MSTNKILDYDGTPTSTLRETITDLQQQIKELERTLRAIHFLCNEPRWTAERRWKIRDLSARAR